MKYRHLEKDETIEAGDDIDRCADSWSDDPVWEPVSEGDIGKKAPDPQYPSHRQYRRPIAAEPLNATDARRIELDAEHELAFTQLENQKSIGIVDREQFTFTRNWFRQRNQSTWSTFFPQKFNAQSPVKMLQIGVFEGMDLVWCLQNILMNRGSHAVAVDPWYETRKINADEMDAVRMRALYNLSQFPGKVTVEKDTSSHFLKHKHTKLIKGSFDLAVIDGDHTADAVYEDACLVLPLMKPGGWMVFDDVRNRVRKKDHVQQGLDRFIRLNPGATKLAWRHRYCDCLEVR